MKNKKDKIRKRALDMLKESYKEAAKNVDKALASGAVNVEGWDENSNSMLLPKAIVSAVLIKEAGQYDGVGSCFEKSQKKEIKNIGYFI